MNSSSTAVRLNPFKGLLGPEGRAIAWSPYGRILDERPVFTLDPLFHAGCYYVQDASAMYVGHIFRKALDRIGIKGIKVLDLCAAPGGKSTDLAASLRERYGDDFLLVSNEVMKERARVLASNVSLWGDPNVFVCSVDPAVLGELAGFFDIIVADVPCSGEGMFRKDERAVKEWSEQTVQLCCARQKRILADIWPSLREGGILVYSTCTYEKCENDDNLLWAAQNLGGNIIAPEDEFPQLGVEMSEYGNLLRAGVVEGEGQWVGSLVKCSPCPKASRKLDSIRPLRFGVNKGEFKGHKFVPDPDYALSLSYGHEYPEIELSREQALEYLHHDSLCFPQAPLGYNMLSYMGQPLGFVNNLGRRCNNLHPNERRILMNIK
ncbi:MAG: hypothetical protein ACI4TL_06445 [Candidatus Cryptobacteroides sp.]